MELFIEYFIGFPVLATVWVLSGIIGAYLMGRPQYIKHDIFGCIMYAHDKYCEMRTDNPILFWIMVVIGVVFSGPGIFIVGINCLIRSERNRRAIKNMEFMPKLKIYIKT